MGSRGNSLSRTAPAQPDAAAGRAAVVVNGNAKGATPRLIGMLGQVVHRDDLFVSRSLEEGREIARTIVERGYGTVFTGGGDGTFVQMVSWIAELKSSSGELPRFGFLKLGRGNALAWVVGAEKQKSSTVAADLRRAQEQSGTLMLRLVEVENLLTPFAGVGADAIALDHSLQLGRFMRKTRLLRPLAANPATYAIAILGRTVPEYAFLPPLRVTVVNRGEPALRIGPQGEPQGEPVAKGEVMYQGPAGLLAFSSIPYWGFGARIFPYAEERADRFSLRIADFGALTVFSNLRSIWRGTFRHQKLQDFLVDAISIDCERPTPLQVGGEVVGHRTEVFARLSSLPIRVVDYRSPSAARRSRLK